jgi:hypothetical protein
VIKFINRPVNSTDLINIVMDLVAINTANSKAILAMVNDDKELAVESLRESSKNTDELMKRSRSLLSSLKEQDQ